MITWQKANEYWSENWRQKNLYGNSKIAILFPNVISEAGGALNKKVHIPIVAAPIKQKDYSGTTGFVEQYTTDTEFITELTENYTVYNRIDKIDKLAPNWASAKEKAIEADQAQTVDTYVLAKLAETKNLIPNPKKIDKSNITDVLSELKRFIKSKNGDPAKGFLFADYSVIAAIQNLDNTSGAKPIEGSAAMIIATRGFNFIECDLSKFKLQLIFANPSAFGWAAYQHTPLQAGTYTQGPYLGQDFVAQNTFYGGKIGEGLEHLIVGYAEAPSENGKKEATPAKLAAQVVEELRNLNQNILRVKINSEKETPNKELDKKSREELIEMSS